MKPPYRRSEQRGLSPAAARWIAERIDLQPLWQVASGKTVPWHRLSWIYLFGGAALFLLALQVLTGGLLMLYYQPTEAAAHASVERIMTEVPFGWLLRSVHRWSADFFVALVGLHLLVKLLSRAYRKPHELTWITGMLLGMLALGFGFSGYLLPWNELSYYATLVGTQIPGTLPVVGDAVVQLLRGGDHVSGETITRFYAAHVMFLPLLTGLLIFLHVALIQAQGTSLPLGMKPDEVRERKPFLSEFLLIDACFWLVLLGVIVSLASLFPAEVGTEADPLQPAPAGIKPEWYFWSVFQMFKYVPEVLAVGLLAAVGLFFLILPWLDRASLRGQRSLRWTLVFLVFLAVAAVLHVIAWRAPGPAHPAVPGNEADPPSLLPTVVWLTLLWAVIGYLVFFLVQLLRLNGRVRRLYRRAE